MERKLAVAIFLFSWLPIVSAEGDDGEFPIPFIDPSTQKESYSCQCGINWCLKPDATTDDTTYQLLLLSGGDLKSTNNPTCGIMNTECRSICNAAFGAFTGGVDRLDNDMTFESHRKLCTAFDLTILPAERRFLSVSSHVAGCRKQYNDIGNLCCWRCKNNELQHVMEVNPTCSTEMPCLVEF